MLTKQQKTNILKTLHTATANEKDAAALVLSLATLKDKLSNTQQAAREAEKEYCALSYKEMTSRADSYNATLKDLNYHILSYKNNIKRCGHDLLNIINLIVLENHITADRKATETTAELLNDFVCDTLIENNRAALVETNTYTGRRYNKVMNISITYDGFYCSMTETSIYNLLNETISSRVDWKRDTLEAFNINKNSYIKTTHKNYKKADETADKIINKINALRDELETVLKTETGSHYHDSKKLYDLVVALNNIKYIR